MRKLDDRGNVAIVVALCLPLVIGGAAYGVEVGYWRYDQVRLQQVADVAAYAGAVVKRAGGTDFTGAATTAASTDGYNATTDTIKVNAPSTATPGDPNSVEAVMTRTETPWFSSLFTNKATVVRVSATASYSTAGDACVLALSPSAAKAADFAGNSSLTLNGCSVMSDSLASNAFNLQGSADLSVPCVYSAGGDSLGGTLSLTSCAGVKTYQPPVADPYASLAMPSYSGKCKAFNANSVKSGDNLCGMDLKGSITLPAGGTYIINGGNFNVNANADVTCVGCTFYLVNGAGVSMNGNSQVNLSAPTSGTYAGMLFISDRSNSAGITVNGNNSSSITGAIYAPDGNVSYIGNFSGTSGCTQIVAQTVSWSGNTTFNDNCSAYGMTGVPIGSVVKLSA